MGVMNTRMNNAQFEAVGFLELTDSGYPPGEARRILALRYPMVSELVIREFAFRGLDITLAHVEAYYLARSGLISYDRKWKLDGTPFVVSETFIDRTTAAALWEFCVEIEPFMPKTKELATVADMLAGLRSDDQATRNVAGCLLARSITGGLLINGETDEDVEYLIGPALSDFITRAVNGEAAAVDYLESQITTEQPAKLRQRSVNN